MPNYATRRLSDGLLMAVQNSPRQPDTTSMQQKGVARLGGLATDYELVELSDEQVTSVRAAGGTFSFLNEGTISQATAPTFSLDKTEITADGVDAVTLSVNCQDAAYAGNVYVRIRAGLAEPMDSTLIAAAGVVSETITTLTLGRHEVMVWTDKHGEAVLYFEGI